MVIWLTPNSRIELSRKTYLNAISKAANYLTSCGDFEPNVQIQIELDNHWQAPVWTMAALISGIGISDKSDSIFCFSDNPSPKKTYVISSDPFGLPEKNLPSNCENVSLEVKSYPDFYSPAFEIGNTQISLDNAELNLSQVISQIPEVIEKYRIHGRFALEPKNTSGLSLELILLQTLIPAFTSNSVVLLNEIAKNAPVLIAEKVLTTIEI